MHAAVKILDTRMEPVRKVVNGVIITMFAVQVLVVFSQVVWRFIFNSPFSWSEELARYLQVWIILLASVACIRKGRHLAVDYAVHALPEGPARALKKLIMVLTLFFTGAVIIFGCKMIAVTIQQHTPALRIPIVAVYLAFPAVGLLMFMEALILLLKTCSAETDAHR